MNAYRVTVRSGFGFSVYITLGGNVETAASFIRQQTDMANTAPDLVDVEVVSAEKIDGEVVIPAIPLPFVPRPFGSSRS